MSRWYPRSQGSLYINSIIIIRIIFYYKRYPYIQHLLDLVDVFLTSVLRCCQRHPDCDLPIHCTHSIFSHVATVCGYCQEGNCRKQVFGLPIYAAGWFELDHCKRHEAGDTRGHTGGTAASHGCAYLRSDCNDRVISRTGGELWPPLRAHGTISILCAAVWLQETGQRTSRTCCCTRFTEAILLRPFTKIHPPCV